MNAQIARVVNVEFAGRRGGEPGFQIILKTCLQLKTRECCNLTLN